jgi:hypothetical protein
MSRIAGAQFGDFGLQSLDVRSFAVAVGSVFIVDVIARG